MLNDLILLAVLAGIFLLCCYSGAEFRDALRDAKKEKQK